MTLNLRLPRSLAAPTALLAVSLVGCSTTSSPRTEPGDVLRSPRAEMYRAAPSSDDDAAQPDARAVEPGARSAQPDATLASTRASGDLSETDARWTVQQPSRADSSSVRDPWELTVGGSGASNDSFDTGAANLALSVGYYFSEVVELSLRQGLSYADGSGSASGQWNGVSRVALDFHLPLDCWSPFIGANVGYGYGDTTHESWMGGAEAGVKWYVKDQTFIQGIVEYDFLFDESDRVEDLFEDAIFIYSIGMGIRF